MDDASAPMKYDAFISYRHQEPDKSHARQILKELESVGYKVAIDERDFDPSEPFLTEMERCVDESRFTLAIVTPRYFESGNTNEENIFAVVTGLQERKSRIITLIFEKTEMPKRLFILSGVNFTDPDPLVPPLERLKTALGAPINPP